MKRITMVIAMILALALLFASSISFAYDQIPKSMEDDCRDPIVLNLKPSVYTLSTDPELCPELTFDGLEQANGIYNHISQRYDVMDKFIIVNNTSAGLYHQIDIFHTHIIVNVPNYTKTGRFSGAASQFAICRSCEYTYVMNKPTSGRFCGDHPITTAVGFFNDRTSFGI